MMESIRIDSFISQAGFCARRKVANFLLEHIVLCSNMRIMENGHRVNPGELVFIDGQVVTPLGPSYYIALHKPCGYICASSDPQGRPLAINLIPQAASTRLFNVGRLDLNSSGLILFTNDGHWAKKITHPSSQIEKEYYIETERPFSTHNLNRFTEGIDIGGELYQLKGYFLDQEMETTHLTSANLILTEGKNREIRTVFKYFNAPIKYLKRVRIGSILLSGLSEGKSRILSKNEVTTI